MHANIFDRYEARESIVHRLDPRVKVAVTVLFIVSCVLLPDGAWPAFLAAWALVMAIGLLAGFTPAFVIKRSFIALPFALAAVTLLFTVPGETLGSLDLGLATLTVSREGASRFATVMARSWLSVQMAILLTATTRFPDLMHALHHLHVPAVLIAILGFMYRYLFILADETGRLLRARASRSARPAEGGGGGSIVWRARVAGGMVGQLLLRSMERSERVYQAMVSRGYQGQLLTMNPHVMQGHDWLLGAAAVFLLVLIQAIGHLL